MIYILEGADGEGKTTVAEYISKKTGAEIIHRKQPKTQKDKDDMLFQYICDIVFSNTKNVIWDRCFYSELVYGEIFRDGSVITHDQIRLLENLINANGGGMIIYCRSTIDEGFERATERGEDYVVNKELYEKVFKGYEDLFMLQKRLIPVMIYNIGFNDALLSTLQDASTKSI
jgi:thymidylate kinase